MPEVNYDTPNMELLAKEYNKVLSEYTNNAVSDEKSILERVMILLEEQAEIIEINSRCGSSRINKTLAYIKNLTYRSIVKVNQMLENSAYIPSFQAKQNNVGSVINRLIEIQINIFILLDKLQGEYASRAELLQWENRKTAFLATIK